MTTEGGWYLYDAATHLPLHKLAIGGDVEPRWFPDDPDRLWFVRDTALHTLDVATGKDQVVRDFARDFRKWKPVLVLSKGEAERLRQAQRAWLSFVEADAKFVFEREGNGSSGRLVAVNAREKLTAQRIEALKSWLPH